MDVASVEIGAFTIIPQAFMLVVFLFIQIYFYRILRCEQMFSQIWQRIKEVDKQSDRNEKSIENVLHIKPIIPGEMTNAIELWGRCAKIKRRGLRKELLPTPYK